MKTTTKGPGKMAKNIGLLGIGLCGLCCAVPMIGIIGGSGFLTVISVYAGKASMILFILSGTLFVIWYYKKRQAPSCSIDCDCKTENSESALSK